MEFGIPGDPDGAGGVSQRAMRRRRRRLRRRGRVDDDASHAGDIPADLRGVPLRLSLHHPRAAGASRGPRARSSVVRCGGGGPRGEVRRVLRPARGSIDRRILRRHRRPPGEVAPGRRVPVGRRGGRRRRRRDDGRGQAGGTHERVRGVRPRRAESELPPVLVRPPAGRRRGRWHLSEVLVHPRRQFRPAAEAARRRHTALLRGDGIAPVAGHIRWRRPHGRPGGGGRAVPRGHRRSVG